MMYLGEFICFYKCHLTAEMNAWMTQEKSDTVGI